jgi:hypothetical protein
VAQGLEVCGAIPDDLPQMNRPPVHQPPPAPVVADLIRAGLTRSTALAMESWKAREVLELLRETNRTELSFRPGTPAHGTI